MENEDHKIDAFAQAVWQHSKQRMLSNFAQTFGCLTLDEAARREGYYEGYLEGKTVDALNTRIELIKVLSENKIDTDKIVKTLSLPENFVLDACADLIPKIRTIEEYKTIVDKYGLPNKL